ncbi:hypothetical protein T12_15984 [Trichinella patagoniensis]|uniref:Uncharacterized protein n=1 Tax=Trichinella patagoniensis TaxID=990121 RepID=A0A0V1A8U4_9BILA|nr:hypothetical protein T12_15984 [Trichinella patagoniensis]
MANDASELWIILPLVVCAVLIAIIAVMPVLIRRYCFHCIPEDSCSCCFGWSEFCVNTANYCFCKPCECDIHEEEHIRLSAILKKPRTGESASEAPSWNHTKTSVYCKWTFHCVSV